MMSCNATGGIDTPETATEKLSEVKALLDEAKCEDAIQKLNDINQPDAEIARLRGWANLCRAGATIGRVGKSLYSFDTTLNNLTVVGRLANEMVPTNDTKLSYIDEAINAFGQMGTSTDRSLVIAIAQMVKAAGYIAKYSTNGQRVFKTDIAIESCQQVSCSAATDITCPARMSNTDANVVGNALIAANNEIGSNSTLGNLGTLASQLGGIASASTGAINRCYIISQMLPAE